jgi:hypothetical protein
MTEEQSIFPRRDHGSNLGCGNFMVLLRIMDTGILAIASVSKSGGFALPARRGGGVTEFQRVFEAGS